MAAGDRYGRVGQVQVSALGGAGHYNEATELVLVGRGGLEPSDLTLIKRALWR